MRVSTTVRLGEEQKEYEVKGQFVDGSLEDFDITPDVGLSASDQRFIEQALYDTFNDDYCGSYKRSQR